MRWHRRAACRSPHAAQGVARGRSVGQRDCGGELTKAPAQSGPDLASCKPAEGRGGGELQRKSPLPVPKGLSGTVVSDIDHLAVATLGGGTVCVDTQWMENTDGIELSKDGRFVSFGWNGYEEYGFKLIDRSDDGEVIETGVKPVSAPGGKLIASLEYSESGFGSLNALGIWQVTPEPVPKWPSSISPTGYTDWRFEGWKGDDCIDASATMPSSARTSSRRTTRSAPLRLAQEQRLAARACRQTGCAAP